MNNAINAVTNFRGFQISEPEEGYLKLRLRAKDGDVLPVEAAALYALGAGCADNGPNEPWDPSWPDGLVDGEGRDQRIWHRPSQQWLNDYATFMLGE
jgi:hypothetical protein